MKKEMTFIQKIRRLQQKSGNKDLFGMRHQDEQVELLTKLYAKNGFELKFTCGACPEQYDVLKDGRQVAYYRLRHGCFNVEYPDCGGESIYYSEPLGDGIFDKNERFNEMVKAMRKLIVKLGESPI